MIKSVKQAFQILETEREGIPFKAIRYLRKQPKNKEIEEKIIFAISHAYDDTYYDEKTDFFFPTPLWYSIIAEKYIFTKLIDPVIRLFTTCEDDWDFLNEQGMYLLGLLAKEYPDLVMKKVMSALDRLIGQRSKLAYLFLFDALYFVDVAKYKEWLLEILQKDHLYWRQNFIVTLADLEVKEAIPIIKDLLRKGEIGKWDRADVEEALKELETGTHLYPEQAKPYCEQRGDWEKHYLRFEDRFYDGQDEEEYYEEKPKVKVPPFISEVQINQKLNRMLAELNLEERIKPNDVKNVIYHEADLHGSSKIMLGFAKHAKNKKQFDMIADTIQLAWNYLPHKTLKGLSPYQKVKTYAQGEEEKRAEKPQYNSTKTATYQLFEQYLPSEIKLVRQRDNDWTFEFTAKYYHLVEKYHKLLEKKLPSNALKKEVEQLLFDESHLMEAVLHLARLYMEEGQIKKEGELLDLSVTLMKNLFPKEFDPKNHHLPWGFLENRDFLTLLLHRAYYIQDIKGVLQSIPYFEEIISLNPNDNQGVRAELATLYLKTNQPEKMLELHKKYPDDATQEIALGYILALIKLKRLDEARKQIKKVLPYCKHSIKELFKFSHAPPPDYNPSRITIGGEDEAYLYWQNQGNLWQGVSGALPFLKEITLFHRSL